MSTRLLKVRILTVTFIALFVVGMIPQAVWAGEIVQQEKEIFSRPFTGYDLQDIYIFYDPSDELMTGVAEGIEEIAEFRLNGIRLLPIDSYSDVDYYLNDEPWIALYALQSNLEGVVFPDREMSWREFYQTMGDHRDTQHLVAMGNTLNLETYLTDTDSMMHTSEAEQIDGLLLILYGVWGIMEMCEQRASWDDDYDAAAEDLKKMVLQLYADNFNDFFQRSFEPVSPVGEIDPIAAEVRKQEMYDEHPGFAREAAYHVAEDGSLEEIPMDDLPEDFSPLVQMTSASAMSAGDFKLSDLPFLSGLRGPIGKIVDVLLDILMKAGQTVISIPENSLSSILDIFNMIQPFLGIVTNSNDESPLKAIISALVNEFPFPENLKTYLAPILNALFDMRGNFDSIVSVIGSLLESLLPAVIPEGIMTWLDTILDFSGEFFNLIEEVVSGGKGAFNTILSFVTDNVLTGLLNKTLVATLGLSAGTITELVNKTVTVISTVVKYLSSFDFSEFLKDVGDKLLKVGFNLLTDTIGQDAIDKMMSVIQMALSAVDLVDNYSQESMITLIGQVADDFLGTSNIVGTVEDLARNLLNVTKTFQEGGLSSISSFTSQIDTILNTYASGAASNVRNLVRDALTLITGFFNDGFNAADIPDIFEIVEGVVNLLPPTAEYTLADAAEIMSAINGAVKPILGLVAMVTDSDALKKMISRTVSNFVSELSDIPSLIKNIIQFLDDGDILDGLPDVQNVLNTFGQIAGGIFSVIEGVRGQSFEGIMQSLLMAVGSIVGLFPSFDDVPIDSFLKLLQSFFPDAFGLDKYDMPSPTEIVNEIVDMAAGLLTGIIDPDTLKTILGFVLDIKNIFTDGVQWLLGKAFDWLTGQITPLLDELEDMLNGLFGGLTDLLGYNGELPIGLGEWSLFTLTFDLGLSANFNLNPTPFFEFLRSILFEGRNPFSMNGVGEIFKVFLSFFEISPQFYADLGVEGFDSSKNPMMSFLLEMLGVELSFSGSAHFLLNLFTFREGQFDWEDFFRIIEWGLNLKVAIQRTITLLDILTGGAGGGVLSKLGSYIGLDSISIDIWFALELDIVKKAATATDPEVSTLSIALTIGAALNIGIDIIIAAAKFRGSLEIILTFFQDLASSAPMKITLRLILTLKLEIRFLFVTWKGTWTWEPGGPWDLSPNPGEPDYDDTAVGLDADGDGLGDEYEASIPGLDPNNPDTDSDGANDKLEVQTMNTDPVDPDSDDDGLLDGEEWDLGTNPMFVDSDWDDLTDYDEVKVYLTDPLSQDTDGDALTDAYEVYTAWNITGITPTVTEVVIGGVPYNDHTDPLNPDTDGDSIVDGDEGNTGCYYGLDSLYNDTEGSGFDADPLIFNGGYTHPLDADTDDDSYLQLYNGMIDSQALMFLMDMNDGAEIAGFWIIIYDAEGEPERKNVFTNPCNPDTDGDTGITDRTPQPGAWINSDGYELAQTPPTDPTDGDTDDDGLIDGLEGVLSQYSNHTSPTDADTDDDGLGDMQEMLLGCDPRSSDTDGDMISDGDEFYVFFTNPNLWDSDMDALGDGEEVYLWHSNPMMDDSDGDRLTDGQEVLIYGCDPMDEDGDNDGLSDYEEIVIYGTDPFDYDSDDDLLADGEEIFIWNCDPLNWDTDGDSITEPNENGDMTWPMSDYDEAYIYGTNVTEADSDQDGLGDAYELYLGAGIIPWMDPIPLNASNEDTDGDWLVDGAELIIQNVSEIIYPFNALTIVFRYNTSPVLMDSDNDTLTDYQEVMVFNTNPGYWDTDNDTIDDWTEVWVYGSSAWSNDTDGDGFFDWEEGFADVYPYGAWPPVNWSIGIGTENDPAIGEPPPEPVYPGYSPSSEDASVSTGFVLSQSTYGTDGLNPDTDGDWLPDGSEIHMYNTIPTNKDSDNDGYDDTWEFDTDFDGLPDGIEYNLGLQTLPRGGIFYPDSDLDGIMDGEEVYVYKTHAAKYDTDEDTYGDGLEISLGLNPLVFTSKHDFELALAQARAIGNMAVTSPVNGSTVYQNRPVQAINYTSYQEMWYRYENGTGWSDNVSLSYIPQSNLWHNDTVRWSPGEYTMQVFGKTPTGIQHIQVIHFTVISGDEIPLWIIIAAIAAAVFILLLLLWKTGILGKIGRKVPGPWKTRLLKKDVEAKKSPKTSKAKKTEESAKKTKKDSPSEGKKGGA
ncbi:MAG: hypothetical protein P1Q69_02290 [Candidatus Thorarchaeota archaeon]|nr:hypothetical protein [Candidatus Thorarchaeota archaeon]